MSAKERNRKAVFEMVHGGWTLVSGESLFRLARSVGTACMQAFDGAFGTQVVDESGSHGAKTVRWPEHTGYSWSESHGADASANTPSCRRCRARPPSTSHMALSPSTATEYGLRGRYSSLNNSNE
jgi:hypothetical protein